MEVGVVLLVVDDIKINSKLTLGEDVADLGGLILAWMAWKAETEGKALEHRDGLSPEQRFFVGNAQWACENERDENKRLMALTDPHSPNKYGAADGGRKTLQGLVSKARAERPWPLPL